MRLRARRRPFMALAALQNGPAARVLSRTSWIASTIFLFFGFNAALDKAKTQERHSWLSLLQTTALSTRYPRPFHSTLVSPLRYFGLSPRGWRAVEQTATRAAAASFVDQRSIARSQIPYAVAGRRWRGAFDECLFLTTLPAVADGAEQAMATLRSKWAFCTSIVAKTYRQNFRVGKHQLKRRWRYAGSTSMATDKET